MANKRFPVPFGEIARKYIAMRRQLPRQVSIIAAGHFKDNFRRQGTLDNGTVISWQPRKLRKRKPGGGRDRGGRFLKKTPAEIDSTRALLIKSGRMRRAIQPKPSGDYAVVVNDTPYAEAHNEGTDKMPARPFMVETPDLLDDIEQHFFNEIDKIWK